MTSPTRALRRLQIIIGCWLQVLVPRLLILHGGRWWSLKCQPRMTSQEHNNNATETRRWSLVFMPNFTPHPPIPRRAGRSLPPDLPPYLRVRVFHVRRDGFRLWQQFCAVGVSIWCLSGSVHFLRRNTVDEDPAQCVYQAVDLTAVGQLIWPNKGGESWSGRTIQGSPDRRTPLLDNLLLIPVPPPHHDLAIDRLLRSNSSSLANAVLFSHATKCQLLRSNSSLWWTQCYFLHATKLSIWLITS
jgi:hypothetical protein